MKNIILTLVILFVGTNIASADFSKNPKCRGYGILEQKIRKECLAANNNLKQTQDTSNVKNKFALGEKSKKILKRLKLNTDSKLFKTGKYSTNK